MDMKRKTAATGLGLLAVLLAAGWGLARFSGMGTALEVGQPPAPTVAANSSVSWQRSGDLSPARAHLLGKWGGKAVDAQAVRFFGQPAQAQPLPPQHLPQHPWLAEQNNNGMHSDSYAAKAIDWPAPLGHAPEVLGKSYATFFGGECATVSFDAKGRIMAVCATLFSFKLYLFDPATLQPLAEYRLPLRHSNKTLQIRKIMTDTSGGAYHHLLKGDRPLIADADNRLNIFAVDDSGNGPKWRIEASWDLAPALPKGHLVTDAMPDWAGRYWFITRQGVVGVLHPESGDIRTLQLKDEEIQNSFSVAEDGVYIVSDRAMYRFAVDAQGAPAWTWREVYENDRQPKPGVIGLGSGTTPTLLGDEFVAITDNAGPQMHVVVYRRQADWAGPREVCKVPVFTPGRSVTDNGMIGYGRSLIVTNNYGYDRPIRPVWTEGGISRIDVAEDGQSCELVWSNPDASQTVVPKMSTQTGLVYVYTREPVPGYDARRDAAYAWYLTAIDYRTGQTRFKIHTGTGLNYNNNWAPITLSPWGTAYVGVLGGLVAVRDGAKP